MGPASLRVGSRLEQIQVQKKDQRMPAFCSPSLQKL